MSAVNEGRAAYVLGSNPDANPYRNARLQFPSGVFGFRDPSGDRLASLIHLECQWDSGYAIAKREGKR